MTEVAQIQKQTIDRMQVRIEHLDKLLSLAGEVIITSANMQDLERRVQESVARQKPLGDDSMNVVKTSNEASRRISQDLHDLVMAIRLVEIGDTLRLFRRPIRDLSRLAERLVDPLLHLLRNAVDHGIESPLERTRVGKPARGTVTVSAIDREHHTEITITDDGLGIDAEAAIAKAREMGIAFDEGSETLLDLLCRPGFSMAKKVTGTSGRGVGLDLVHSVMDEFDGRMLMKTAPGEGCRITLEIPKLRAVNIIDALTLRAGEGLFAIPIDQVVASLGIKPARIQTAMGRGRCFTYQGQVVVLHDLQELVGNPPLNEDVDPLPVVIVQSKGRRVALIVSEFLGPQKLVNIPLDDDMQHDPSIAGTSVFTGGKLGLTINVDDLVASTQGQASAPVRSGLAEEIAGLAGREETEPAAPPEKEAAAAPRPHPADGAPLDAGDMSDLVEELRTTLQKLQDALLSLESTPDDAKLMNEAFRRLHAAKGNFTMVEAAAVSDFTHHLETVLDFLRSDKLPITPERIDLLLDGADYLVRAGEALPGSPPEPPEAILAKLQEETATSMRPSEEVSSGDLIGRAFELSPTAQLQVLSALKRGEHTYESYLTFESGRQADFLAAYLLLRRIGIHGSILATLPSVAEIEQGRCGRAVKILWSTPLDDAGVEEKFRSLAPLYNLKEFSSLPTTIFRYEQG